MPAKAIAPGATDVVTATIKLNGDLNSDKVQFVTGTGTVYASKVLDKDNGIYEVTLVGGPASDAQEVYALYPQEGSKPLNLGKLLVASYAQTQLNIKLVPVNGASGFDSQRISDSLNAIYNPVNVKVNVSVAANFDTDAFDKSQGLAIGGKNFFNAYSDDMKALNSAYTSSIGVYKNTAYLFVLNKAKDGSVLGDMPRSKQFGYIFLQNNNDVEHTVAHEIGHGIFDLQHVFEYSGITQGMLPDNVMDYPAGGSLTKYQWDCLHAPALLAGVLDNAKDAEYETDGHYSTVYLVCLMLGMPSQQAKQLATAAEDPDTDIHSDTEFELDQTWAYPGKQQNIHSLTGGFHGVEEMMTAFKFLYTEKSNIKQQGQLLHRYGDTYAHSRLDNMLPESLKSESISPEKVSQYIDAWKNQEGTEMKSEIKPWIKFLNYYINQYGYDFLTNESEQKAYLHGKTLPEYLHEIYLNQPSDAFVMYGNWFYTSDHAFSDDANPDYIYVRPKWYLTYVQNLAVLIAYKYQLDIKKLDMTVFNKMVDFSSKNKCWMKGIIDYEIAKKENRKYFYVPVYYSTLSRLGASYDAIRKTDYLQVAKDVVANTQKYMWEQGFSPSNVTVEEIKGPKKVNKNGTFDTQAYKITFQ